MHIFLKAGLRKISDLLTTLNPTSVS